MPRLEKPKENQCFWEASEPGFSDFSDFPQMENRDLGWTGLGLGSPKTLFSANKSKFLGYFWPFPFIWGFPLGSLWGLFGVLPLGSFFAISHYLGVSPGSPIGPYWPLCNSRYTAHWPLLVLLRQSRKLSSFGLFRTSVAMASSIHSMTDACISHR